MTTDLHQFLSEETNIVIDGEVKKVPNWELIAMVLPIIKKLTDSGMSLQEIENGLKLYIEEPWRD